MNTKVVLRRRPLGEPQVSDFAIIKEAVPDLKEKEVRLKTLYFSLDPYMRGLMSESPSYLPPYALEDALSGAAICIVEESHDPRFKVGDIVLSTTGWQTYAVIQPKLIKGIKHEPNIVHLLPSDIKPSLYLGALGIPGFAAYYGLYQIGHPKKGETVVVSAATGPVGSMVGQLAKQIGCHVVGIAGSPQKCEYAVEVLGFDVCLDRKSRTFRNDLKKACVKGIDIYFENVGGPVFSAVFPLLNPFARIPVCGLIAWYNDLLTLNESNLSFSNVFTKIRAFFHILAFDQSPVLLAMMIGKKLTFQGFIVSDHADEYDAFLNKVYPLIKSGQIKYKEDIVKGIEKAPETFCRLFKGKNFGKVIIEI